MPSTVYSPTGQWSAEARYTAPGDVDVLISNAGGDTAHFDVTADDTAPAITVGQGHPVQPGTSRAMVLKAGERLWLAGRTVVTLGVLAQ